MISALGSSLKIYSRYEKNPGECKKVIFKDIIYILKDLYMVPINEIVWGLTEMYFPAMHENSLENILSNFIETI